jgi:uncharacterized protein YndB with AHSA1/START domain
MPEEPRQHISEIEIDATPDQVFRALTEADQIVRWFAPEAKVDPRVGGEFMISWGPGMEGRSTIAIWEPGRRFATVRERSRAYGAPPEEGEPVQRIVIDYQIEALAGGKTLLRLVHSGFGQGAGWDNEFESTRTGWSVFLRTLKVGLELHPGEDSVQLSMMVPAPQPPEEIWSRLLAATPREPGAHYSVQLSPEAQVQGAVIVHDPPRVFSGIAENLDNALFSLQCMAGGPNQAQVIAVGIVLWGEARKSAPTLEQVWKEAMGVYSRPFAAKES